MKPLTPGDIGLSGLNLIEASAGTGKTWTIAALYIRLLLEGELRPENILVVTYTKAATAELRDRIRQRIATTLELFTAGIKARDELEALLLKRCRKRDRAVRLLTRALYSFDDAAIFTIHGFCQRALAENAFESGSLFDTDMTADQSALVQEAADDFWRTALLGRKDAFLERLVAEGLTPESLLTPFRGHVQTPGLHIVPETKGTVFNTVAARRDELFRQALPIWKEERDGILTMLKRPGLHQASYKPAQIEAAAALLDAWFDGLPSLSCDRLLLFTSEHLEKKTTKGNEVPCHPFFVLCQRLYEACHEADHAFGEEWAHLLSRFHAWLLEELPRRKRLRNVRSYDDLLLDLHRALEGDGGDQLASKLRERYHAALIDEFQDTDPLQWRIFGRLAGLNGKQVSSGSTKIAPYPLYLIGDPKQAIYSFRGADLFAYLEAARSVDDAMRWGLDTNRRSTAALVQAVNTVFRADDPFLCGAIGHGPVKSGRDPHDGLLVDGRPDTAPLRFWIYPRLAEKVPAKGEARGPIAAAVAAEIARLLAGPYLLRNAGEERNLLPGDIAVLVRTHTQANLIQEALTTRGIPSVQQGNMTIFETPEALDLLRILRAAAEPYREPLVTEALLGGLGGLNVDMVVAAQEDGWKWERWLESFHGLREAYHSGGIMSLASFLLDGCGVRERLLCLPDGERRLTNLLHCVELLHGFAQEGDDAIESLIAWLEQRITGITSDETALLRLETDDNAVRIATIHASKGLQYPLVFLPFVWDVPANGPEQVIFHDAAGHLTLDLGSSQQQEHRQAACRERDGEAARLLYVALTRAEFRCYVVWGAISQADASPLFRLIHGLGSPPLKELDDAAVLAALRELEEAASGINSEIMPPPEPTPAYRPPTEDDRPLVCPPFTTSILTDWRVSSFSSLAGGLERHLQPQDYDTLVVGAATETGNDELLERERGGIFDFPRGAASGTCLHEIFERLDYARMEQADITRAAAERLRANGYSQDWLPAVSAMVTDVTRTALLPDDPDFCLSRLQPGSWRAEMEFFLPIRQLSPDALRALFDGQLDQQVHGDFSRTLNELSFKQVRGMLQGFMDMVFEHNGRYYIIDWKSNHLGYRREEYGPAGLRESMARHSYVLQYHLYTLALDRILRLHLPEYDYDTHCGGAIYVFLRGVSPVSAQYGIYRDKPSSAFIRRAGELLLASGETAMKHNV
ncbi:exodeoxyribonuclease V subunit beta [Geobacter sp. AOG2]|uniref:exodeoxyribonuclease V subunit beta n=1 Tax=Geobacter sp. AOG2 TaxID=1566347 RepID=UPI001CC5F016|nr:exodeoxyribonuclease V subunit beta [Geobacter sp. AOG2]GFE60608.1 RecBCD enzyme subunit RecB [Geobacter sp. AOG2]